MLTVIFLMLVLGTLALLAKKYANEDSSPTRNTRRSYDAWERSRRMSSPR